MKIITLTEKNFETALTEAAGVIRRGGTIVYPTDTAYGLGVDATNREAVQKLYTFKHRDRTQPTHVVVSGKAMAEKYICPGKLADLWPGPLTIVADVVCEVPRELLCNNKTLGVRVPDNRFAQALAHSVGGPITTPSANFQGDKTPYTLADVLDNFGDANPGIDLVIDGGELPGGVSTLVQIHNDATLDIIREGVITKEQIAAVVD